jgi:tetratricopeptide (TPR) repeat protein
MKADAHCSLLNRRCVALRSLSRRDEAIRIGHDALEEARTAGLQHLEMQNHIDLGYIYYGRLADRDDLFEQWSTAVDLIRPEQIPSSVVTSPNVWHYHAVHVLTLRGQLDEAIQSADDAAARAATELDTFHHVKLLLMRVVIELMRPAPSVDYRELRETTDRVLDLCIRYNTRQTYWMSYYALAKIAERQNDRQSMKTNALAAVEQLIAFIGRQPEMQRRFHESLRDLAITARKAGSELPEDALAFIEAPSVRGELRSILAMSDSAFSDYCDGHVPASTYHDGRFDLPCP